MPYSLSTEAHLASYQEVDISLDPFPFCGHISSLESLWMGVPVITLEGQTAFGRVTGSFLHLLGLNNLIAKTPEEYVKIATEIKVHESKI